MVLYRTSEVPDNIVSVLPVNMVLDIPSLLQLLVPMSMIIIMLLILFYRYEILLMRCCQITSKWIKKLRWLNQL